MCTLFGLVFVRVCMGVCVSVCAPPPSPCLVTCNIDPQAWFPPEEMTPLWGENVHNLTRLQPYSSIITLTLK